VAERCAIQIRLRARESAGVAMTATTDAITTEALEAEGFRETSKTYREYSLELTRDNWIEVSLHNDNPRVSINDGAEDRVRLSRKFETMSHIRQLIQVLRGSK
jgi:hypothetical protein